MRDCPTRGCGIISLTDGYCSPNTVDYEESRKNEGRKLLWKNKRKTYKKHF